MKISEPVISAEPNFLQSLNGWEIGGAIAVFISCMLLIRFFVNLWKINHLAFRNERIKKEGFTLVKIKQNVSPFSFFNYLFE